MCGIFGYVGMQINDDLVKQELFHRGPDEQQYKRFSNGLVFHHFRLSIIDKEGGSQPMNIEHLTIVFNGEIYNHEELKSKYNMKCSSRSDTETLLRLYLLKEEQMLSELDGMFAFAIYDSKKNQLFLARDRAGKNLCTTLLIMAGLYSRVS